MYNVTWIASTWIIIHMPLLALIYLDFSKIDSYISNLLFTVSYICIFIRFLASVFLPEIVFKDKSKIVLPHPVFALFLDAAIVVCLSMLGYAITSVIFALAGICHFATVLRIWKESNEKKD